MHLARTVTHTTLAETKRRMSSSEFAKWCALYRINPWGDDWLQAAIVSCSTYNPHVSKKGRKLRIDDVIPRKKRKQTVQEMQGILSAFFRTAKARHDAQCRQT